MKTTALLAFAGIVAAESRDSLVSQRDALLAELNNVDDEIVALAAPANSTPSANTTGNATGNATGNSTAGANAGGSNTGLIVGCVVGAAVLIGVGVFIYKKKQGSEENEGGDDLFSKLVQDAWNRLDLL